MKTAQSLSGRITCITAAAARPSHPDLTLSAPPLEVLTSAVFLISGNKEAHRPLLPLTEHCTTPPLSLLVSLEATGLLGTAYLQPVPYQIVDVKRYPSNENIFLLLTLTLAYMDLHLHRRWDKQLLCGAWCVCVSVWGRLPVSELADRCIK